ncbi:hypothetical protein ACHAWF_015206 [Thalassiosira exigua]
MCDKPYFKPFVPKLNISSTLFGSQQKTEKTHDPRTTHDWMCVTFPYFNYLLGPLYKEATATVDSIVERRSDADASGPTYLNAARPTKDDVGGARHEPPDPRLCRGPVLVVVVAPAAASAPLGRRRWRLWAPSWWGGSGCTNGWRRWTRGGRAILDAMASLEEVVGGDGAMCVMGKLPEGTDDREFASSLVERHGVAVNPGSFCGLPGWIRVCYSNLPPEDCRTAAARLKGGIEERTIGVGKRTTEIAIDPFVGLRLDASIGVQDLYLH